MFCDLLFRVGQAKNSPKHQKRKKEKKTLSAATLARLGYFDDATPPSCDLSSDDSSGYRRIWSF